MVGIVGNRRTQYTKKVIRKAFQEILMEKEFEKSQLQRLPSVLISIEELL